MLRRRARPGGDENALAATAHHPRLQTHPSDAHPIHARTVTTRSEGKDACVRGRENAHEPDFEGPVQLDLFEYLATAYGT